MMILTFVKISAPLELPFGRYSQNTIAIGELLRF